MQRAPRPLQPAAKGEHLLDDFRAPLHAHLDGGDDILVLSGRKILPQHGHRHHDRGEDIVQVMREAAGKGADAFHPLRAQELGFEILLRGDVDVDAQERFRIAAGIPHQRGVAAHGQLLARLGDMLMLAARFPGLEHLLVDRLRHAGVHADQFPDVVPLGLGRSPAVQTFGPLVPEGDPARVDVAHDDRIVRLVQHRGLFANALLGALALGEIVQHHLHRGPSFMQEGVAADFHGDGRAIQADAQDFSRKFAPVGLRFLGLLANDAVEFLGKNLRESPPKQLFQADGAK